MSSKSTISISNKYRFYLVAISCSLVIFVALLSFMLEYNRFKKDSTNLKEIMLEAKKTEIKNLVQASIHSIDVLRQDLNLKMRKELKLQVHLANDIACNIYRKNKEKKSRQEIEQMIKHALRPVHFFNGRGYLFMTSMSGTEFLYPPDSSLEGKNMFLLKDVNGGSPMMDIMTLLKNADKGFVSYYWSLPKKKSYSFLKTAYIQKLPFYDLFIGTGDYIDILEDELKERALAILKKVSYDDGEYLFINEYNGTILNTVSSEYKIGDNLKNNIDERGRDIFKDQFREATKLDGGFFNFTWSSSNFKEYQEKIAYVKVIPEWEWIIGGSIDQTHIEKLISLNKVNLYDDYKRHLLYVSLIVLFAISIALFMSKFLKLKIDLVFNSFLEELEEAVNTKQPININALKIEEFRLLGESTNVFLKRQREVFKKLEQSEQKFRMLIKNVPVMILGLDNDQKVTIYNRAVQKFTGRRSNSVMGKYFTIDDFFETEDSKKIREKMINSKKQFTIKSYTTKTGVEFSHVWSHFELASGERMYVGYDITEQIKREKVINNQKLLLEKLIDTMPLPIFYKRIDGVYEGCNKAYADFLNMPVENIIGKKLEDLYPEETRNRLIAKDAELLKNGGVQVYQTTFKDIKESTRFGKMYKALYTDHTGKNIGMLGIALDVTESVNYARDLEDINNTKDRFFSIIAHDLKNPFNSLLGILEILREDYDVLDDLTRKDFLSTLDRTSNRLFRLLSNLLEWSRTQTGSIQYNPVYLNISELVYDTLNVLVVQAEKKGVTLTFDFDKDIFSSVDENMMSSVIRNLVNNAIKFTPEGGDVRFVMDANKELLHIKIQDTGVGMSQEVINKLFKIEETHSTVGTNNELGTGLGLILCKEFIDKHNGSLLVSSVLEKGSEFLITIPQ